MLLDSLICLLSQTAVGFPEPLLISLFFLFPFRLDLGLTDQLAIYLRLVDYLFDSFGRFLRSLLRLKLGPLSFSLLHGDACFFNNLLLLS